LGSEFMFHRCCVVVVHRLFGGFCCVVEQVSCCPLAN
jgi:hypothetical protein